MRLRGCDTVGPSAAGPPLRRNSSPSGPPRGAHAGGPAGSAPAAREEQQLERPLQGDAGGDEHERAIGEERRVERRKRAVVPGGVAREGRPREPAAPAPFQGGGG